MTKKPTEKSNDTLTVDFSMIPDHVQDQLAEATMDAVKDFLSQPGGREKLDAKNAAREARQKE